MVDFKSIVKTLLRAANLLEAAEKERDVTISGVYEKIYDGLYGMEFEYPYIMEHMFDDSQQYIVVAEGGKLWRVDVNINEEVVTLENKREVKIDFPEVESRTRVFRDNSGQLKFVSISSAAVLNRVGEIDTKSLFDSFEENFEEFTNKKDDSGFLTFRHLGDNISFGELKGCFRINSLLIIYGNVDESTILGSVAEKRFQEEKWGVSIGFMPLEEPQVINIDGIEIRTYNKGYLVELSVLREDQAASYFTNILSLKRDYTRMGKNREEAKKGLLEFLGDSEDAEKKVEQLLDDVALRERTIGEQKLIVRDSEEQKDEEKEDVEINLTDEALEAIANKVAEKLKPVEQTETEVRTANEDIKRLTELIMQLTGKIEGVEARSNESASALEQLKKTDDKKLGELLEDTPAARKRGITIGYRATEERIQEHRSAKSELPESGELDIPSLRQRATKNKSLIVNK